MSVSDSGGDGRNQLIETGVVGADWGLEAFGLFGRGSGGEDLLRVAVGDAILVVRIDAVKILSGQRTVGEL